MTHRNQRLLMGLCLWTAGLLLNPMAHAHGGEDHSHDAPTPAAAVTGAARAFAQSDDFELVAVVEEAPAKRRRLLLTLDRFATNEPVAAAKLEVQAADQAPTVQEISAGLYSLAWPALDALAPGAKLPITVTIETDDASDLLVTELTLPAALSATTPTSTGTLRSSAAVLGAGAALLGAAALVLGLRARRKHGRAL